LKILVAGAAGFLGSHLSENLVKQGYSVIGVDNLYTGYKSNITTLIESKNFTFIEHDVTRPIDLKIDQIYNLACPASPIHYQKHPVQTIKTSVMGSINLLDLALENNARILQASTSEVYGDPNISPQPETYWGNVNPIGIRACYDEGKRASETLFFDYHRQYGVDIKVARIFNTYGPRMDLQDGRVVSNFVLQALRNEPLTIYGDGSQTRSFCFVSDLIEGLVKLMDSPSGVTGPINIGNPNEFSMLELASIVKELTNSKSVIEFHPLPGDDPKQRKPDISLAEQALNWSPKVQLREGLHSIIEDFRIRINS
jgi:UDP-glucuronate decarboxylase